MIDIGQTILNTFDIIKKIVFKIVGFPFEFVISLPLFVKIIIFIMLILLSIYFFMFYLKTKDTLNQYSH